MADKDAPAFPTWEFQPSFGGSGHHVLRGGISRRDYFAAAALTGLMMQDKQAKWFDEMATWAFQAADAMIAESQKGDTP